MAFSLIACLYIMYQNKARMDLDVCSVLMSLSPVVRIPANTSGSLPLCAVTGRAKAFLTAVNMMFLKGLMLAYHTSQKQSYTFTPVLLFNK